jgi:glucose-1-phosphate thymidylyltransferase
MTGFYTFTPEIFHACHLVQPSNRGEYEISDAIDLLLHSGRTIDAIRMDGWRTDIGYPEDREAAERRIQGADADAETDDESESADATAE